jgi:hypothetical protein
MLRNQPHSRIAAVMCILPALLASALAGSVRKADLEEMVRLSGNIIVGTCISVQPSHLQYHGQMLPVTRYTFRISDSIKGSASGDFVLVQFGWPRHLTLSNPGASVARLPIVVDELPEYQLSQEYLLLLTRPSSLGLSSPIGLGQSTFRAEPQGNGHKTWKNSLGNRELFKDGVSRYREQYQSWQSAPSEVAEPVLPYREFVDMVRELALRGK